ncbi:hypothetical protein IWZ00DRAFT_188300 [Phyllosticta capitalensis]
MNVDEVENKGKMLRGELYYAFTPKLTAERQRCQHACKRYNNAGEVSRRKLVELWRDIVQDPTPMPSEEKFWRAFAASEKSAAEGGAFGK